MDSFLNDWKTYFRVGSVIDKSMNCIMFIIDTIIISIKYILNITSPK